MLRTSTRSSRVRPRTLPELIPSHRPARRVAWLPLLAGALLLCAPAALSAGDGGRRVLIDGKLGMRLPADWVPLDAEAVRARLGGASADRAFGTADGARNLAVDFPERAFAPEEVKALCQQVGAQVEAAGFAFVGAKQRKLGGQQFCVVDFRRELAGGALRVTRAVTSFEGRYLALTFTVGVADEARWARTLAGLLGSIQLTPIARGGACRDGERQQCVGADQHALCSAGKWQLVRCADACKEHATVGCRYNEQSRSGHCTCTR